MDRECLNEKMGLNRVNLVLFRILFFFRKKMRKRRKKVIFQFCFCPCQKGHQQITSSLRDRNFVQISSFFVLVSPIFVAILICFLFSLLFCSNFIFFVSSFLPICTSDRVCLIWRQNWKWPTHWFAALSIFYFTLLLSISFIFCYFSLSSFNLSAHLTSMYVFIY